MPGGHNENSKLLGFFADKDLTAIVDEARGGVVRSQFLREAVVEYMVKRGVDVPEHLKHPPSRAGKGGPRSGRLNSASLTGTAMVEEQVVSYFEKPAGGSKPPAKKARRKARVVRPPATPPGAPGNPP